MLKFVLCALLLCNFSSAVYSQKKEITLTLNPFSFLEFDAGFTPGISYAVSDKLCVLTDAGLIFYDLYTNTQNNTGATNTLIGYKFKPEIRWYPRSEGPVQKGFFLSVEFMYKHVRYNRYNGVPVLDNTGNLAYTDFSGYKIIKDVYGAAGKLGFRVYFDKANKFGLDIYAGLGARNKVFAVKDVPPGGSINENFDGDGVFNPHFLEGSTANFPSGIKLVWRL